MMSYLQVWCKLLYYTHTRVGTHTVSTAASRYAHFTMDALSEAVNYDVFILREVQGRQGEIGANPQVTKSYRSYFHVHVHV